MTAQNKILLVEDDPRMQRLVQTQLTAQGYVVEVAGDGASALDAVSTAEPALVLLDITLPKMDGLQVCRELREWSDVPIILLTAIDDPATKTSALESGADDYVTKPFHIGELIARMRAVLRRVTPQSKQPAGPVQINDLLIDLEQHLVTRAGEIVRLTKIEFGLLRELLTHADKLLTYDHLLQSVWGDEQTDVRPVHVHICNLRRKLEASPTGPRRIISAAGVGYRFRLHDAA